jgi:2-methylcitrate dehydratase PrpD
MAAFGAQSGSTGLTTLLEPDGLFRMLSAPNPAPERLTRDPGAAWRIESASYKAWPCCGLIMGPMRDLVALLREHPLQASDVEAIDAEVVHALRLPRFTNTEPRTFASRQFSLPHGLAMILLGIAPGPAWLSASVAEHPTVRSLRARITVREHPHPWPPRAPAAAAGRPPSAVTLRARGGTYRRETPPGSPIEAAGARWDDAAFIAKFRSLVAPDQGEAIIGALADLDKLADVAALSRALERAKAVPWESDALRLLAVENAAA